MKIMAQIKRSRDERLRLEIPEGVYDELMKGELLKRINTELLKFPQLFYQDKDTESSLYELQYIVLSLEDLGQLRKLLKDAGVNEFYQSKIRNLLIEKPTT